MRRSVLHVADVLRWADAHHKRKGRFPTTKDGRVLDQPDESWRNIDTALRAGFRGFPGVWSLAQLLAERREYRNRKSRPKYSVSQILRWADAHYRRFGRWPIESSGAISDAKGETWCAVNVALRNGQRGLLGGSSLAQLLAARRKVRNRADIGRLTIRRILAWADAHRERTGTWPTARSGTINDSAGETWHAVDCALKNAKRGIRHSSSLAKMLARYRGVARHMRRPHLSIERILQWADEHHRRTGRWPTEKSGAIAGTGETWLRVQLALRQGGRGLPGGSSLATLLAEHRGVRNIQNLPQLGLAQIRRWIHEHVRRTGQLPNSDSSFIPYATVETWQGVDYVLKHARCGLPEGWTLARLVKSI